MSTYSVRWPDSILVRHTSSFVALTGSKHHADTAWRSGLWNGMIVKVDIEQKEDETEQCRSEAVTQATNASNHTLSHTYSQTNNIYIISDNIQILIGAKGNNEK